ncbi:hypothetical protein BJY04DRAFT_232448 [Aspergillus karnatakaensis]|uniref:DUF3500 domain-containing protein n=1 Tax=Aspergillus karnatakaensis TaxID=1810916 RepID=UPI003CCD53D9
MREHTVVSFREYVPAPDNPRHYSNAILTAPVTAPIFDNWVAKLNEPFVGITTDGQRQDGLFQIQDEDAPVERWCETGCPYPSVSDQHQVAVAEQVWRILTPEERSRCTHAIDSPEWRKWSNPELLIFETGVRLESLHGDKILKIMFLIQASLSPKGYEKITAAMEINHFLGELLNAKPILNRNSYQFALFGVPSLHEPWGFALYGHHLCLNIFILGRQMTIGPVFIGAEPNVIDAGALNGLTLCKDEETYGLQLMQTLPRDLQRAAQIYPALHDERMPPGRWNPADQRHIGGAFQDNRVIPFEGINATDMPPEQQTLLLKILESYLVLLPEGPFQARMRNITSHLPNTYFSWIGGYGDDDPFYFRIQSPVILVEFDHHSGVFLLNEQPEKYHIHTILRTPNGNDYGQRLVEEFRARRGSLFNERDMRAWVA